ncbi:hypothetical protein E5284_10360 [Citrobacter freundii]|uniref:hypothetical protein n=1 Tax=Citrobacter freundii TaxID=546 RepID=UPI001093A89D|nr:hypothetical protein [Citrobacter freundii]QCA18251.1 hypothetical protein E5284_10360 [Citrobacter freundii]QLS05742.1 hypothetical protein HV327_09105 [Citrobacter freundii]WQI92386.1 hypothetical protein R5O97_05945 [Citrobacter freundii]
MNNFIQALELSIKTQNWYSVLFISLSLPDICGKIDEPCKGSKVRTVNWFNKYMKGMYTHLIGHDRQEHTFLTGSDFYSLRCAYLHEGSDDITSQKAREILEKFEFIQPTNSNRFFHCNQENNLLQLQVDQFGKEVMAAVLAWLKDIENDPEKTIRINALLKIKII